MVSAILRTGGLDLNLKEAWPLYRSLLGVRLCWELEEPTGPEIIEGIISTDLDTLKPFFF
jgi:hypothetical protein